MYKHNTHAQTHAHTGTHKHIHVNTHTHTHTHTQTFLYIRIISTKSISEMASPTAYSVYTNKKFGILLNPKYKPS